MKKNLLLVTFTFYSLWASAQIQFSLPSQVPLLLSPSLAGAKSKARINLATTVESAENQKDNSQYVSVDYLSKKLHSGIGLYFLSTNFKANPINENLKNEIKNIENLNFDTRTTSKTLGLCIAPKFVAGEKSVTFSPSIFGEFRQEKNYNLLDYSYLYQSSYDAQSNQMNTQKEQLHYSQSNFKTVQYNVGLGLALNSEKLLICTKSTIGSMDNTENLNLKKYFYSLDSLHVQNIESNQNLRFVSNTFFSSYSFNFDGVNECRITPSFGLGFRNYLDLGKPKFQNSETTTYYYSQFLNKESFVFDFLHCSIMARLSSVLVGYSYTKTTPNDYKGIVLGYQREKFKLTSTWSFGKKRFAGDLAFSYWFG
jgi:hypothetical protein